ncbi:DUF2474 domain-containing protein [Acetobacter sp.]
MAIIEIVRGDGEGAPRHAGVRFAWFLAIWAASTGLFFIVASIIHALVPR